MGWWMCGVWCGVLSLMWERFCAVGRWGGFWEGGRDDLFPWAPLDTVYSISTYILNRYAPRAGGETYFSLMGLFMCIRA